MRLPAGLTQLARPVPLWLVQRVANAAVARVMSRHPQLFDRLGDHARKSFAFVPTDLPFVFVVTPSSRSVTILRRGSPLGSDVVVSGLIVTLLALAEGRLDGDAEFFARDLAIDGDMEAILALRNAMDDCRIDLPTDLAPATGPLRRPVVSGLTMLRSAFLEQGIH